VHDYQVYNKLPERDVTSERWYDEALQETHLDIKFALRVR